MFLYYRVPNGTPIFVPFVPSPATLWLATPIISLRETQKKQCQGVIYTKHMKIDAVGMKYG